MSRIAKIEQLIASVDDPQLRAELQKGIRALKDRASFGLIYERHLPETVVIPDKDPLKIGDHVRHKQAADLGEDFRIVDRNSRTATLVSLDSGEQSKVPIRDLLPIKRFGDAVYLGLHHVDEVRRSSTRASHAVINGENYHALQVLALTHKKQVDCIYLDPPYNTGERDWKYNNDYVDDNDSYRHSKWLSMMERRLRLCERLLKDDSVLVVTIDEHEVSRLGVLLEQVFPDADVTLVTIVMMPKGVTRPGTRRFSRVEEYAYFCFFGNAGISNWPDDLLTLGADELEKEAAAEGLEQRRPRWKGLLRSGTNARRRDRQWLFYPVLIDEERGAILGAGEPLLPIENNGKVEWPEPDFETKIDGLTPVWPVRSDGALGNWGISAPTLRTMAAKGYVKLGGYDAKRNTWAVSYLSKAPQEQIAAGILEVAEYDDTRNVVDVVFAAADSPARRVKRVWHRTAHDAGTGGTDIITSFLGGRAFPFAKSLYAVRDTLGLILGDKPDGVVVDAFAGSGTTMHAAMLLNAQDGGNRRSILITNNEVGEERAKELKADGHYPGDPEYEREGIFEAVTLPRIRAAVTGVQSGGRPLVGSYRDGRPFAEGLDENVEFFRLEYLDADRVDLGLEFEAIHPLLWLRAGGMATRPMAKRGAKFHIAPECGYAILFEDVAFRDFAAALLEHVGVTDVFLITDSDEAYAEMREHLGPGRQTTLLYRDYLRHFRRRARP